MNKTEIKERLNECCEPYEKGGYYDYMHPNYSIKKLADWKIEVKDPLNDGDFWFATIGDLTDTQKENAKMLVNFLRNYKIRRTGGREKMALQDNTLLAIKRDDCEYVEIFWNFLNGTNGFDCDFVPAAEEYIKMIKDIREQDFVVDAYLLSSSADCLDDLYSWYTKIVI